MCTYFLCKISVWLSNKLQCVQNKKGWYVTLVKERVDLLAVQVIVHVYFKTQFAEGFVEVLRVLLGPIPFPQGYSVVKGDHRHHHRPVALPPPIHGFSLLLQVRSVSVKVSVLYVSLVEFNSLHHSFDFRYAVLSNKVVTTPLLINMPCTAFPVRL